MVVKNHLYRYYLHPSYQYTLFLFKTVTSNNSIKGVAVLVLIFPKGVKMEKSKLQNLMYFCLLANVYIKQCRILNRKFY